MVRNEAVLQRVEEKNILYTIENRKCNWIRHVLRSNCFLKHAIEGKIEGRVKWQEDEVKEVSSYGMTVRKREYAVNWKKKQ
jgi:hypothetical protein